MKIDLNQESVFFLFNQGLQIVYSYITYGK